VSDSHLLLQRRLAADPDDADARYQLAVLLLDENARLYEAYEPELLAQVREQLHKAIQCRPTHAPAHAALGFTYAVTDDGAEQALECFREARRLDPQHKIYEVYFLTLLDQTGREAEALAEIEAASSRHDVDFHALRHALIAAEMPADAMTLLLNGFIHARNFFRSALGDEAEAIRNRLERGRARRLSAAELKQCTEQQRQLEKSFDPSRVPESIRALAAWASRYGVGDDYCRPLLLKRLSTKQRAKLIREVEENADAIHAWLDSFGQGQMTTEAAAFMYLTLGMEELRE
jgi:hypothetical protein